MPSETINYYNDNADAFAESTFSVDMSHIYTEFLQHVSVNGSILDAGCGSGRDSLYFKNSGFHVTAFDACEPLANIAAAKLQQAVAVVRFEEFEPSTQFDGIWCCASLLHVNKTNLPSVFNNLALALKPTGVMFVSFKYGDTERVVEGRAFTDLTESSLLQIIEQVPQLTVFKAWRSQDKRVGREHEIWLNALIKKNN